MTSTEVWLVAGLGNPGPAYAGHRHNVGYLVADELASRLGSPFRAHKSGRADVVEGRLGPPGSEAPRVVVARARCYMNESGGPVKSLLTFYKLPADRLVVIHDELDIPFGTLRVKLGGGDNGHNGVRSVRSALGTGDFYRVRLRYAGVDPRLLLAVVFALAGLQPAAAQPRAEEAVSPRSGLVSALEAQFRAALIRERNLADSRELAQIAAAENRMRSARRALADAAADRSAAQAALDAARADYQRLVSAIPLREAVAQVEAAAFRAEIEGAVVQASPELIEAYRAFADGDRAGATEPLHDDRIGVRHEVAVDG